MCLFFEQLVMSLFLKNPHSVLAVLELRPQDVFEICLQPGKLSDPWERVRSLAEEVGIPVVDPRPRARKSRKEGGGRTPGNDAVLKPRDPTSIEMLLPHKTDEGLYIALDGVQDPQNLGSIFRAAAFFGVRGLVTTRDRAAPISQTVYDVAAGGVEHVDFALETNLVRVLGLARDRGLWILGSSEHADTALADVASDRPWMLVLGNEESGLRRLTREACDEVCAIRPRGDVTSLNVAVAAGILMAHLAK